MGIKEFFAPTWSKLILFFILMFISIFQIPYISYLTLGLELMIEFVMKSVFNFELSPTTPFIVSQIIVFIGNIYHYFLSCLILFIYDKAKR